MTVGDEKHFTEGDDSDAFVIRLAADRTVLWATTLSGTGSAGGRDILVAGDGTLLLLMGFTGELRVGNDVFDSGEVATTAIVRLTASGAPLMATTYGSDGDGAVYGSALAPLRDGGYVVLAVFDGTTEPRLGSLRCPDEGVPFDTTYPTKGDVLLFAVDASLEPSWSRRFGGLGVEGAPHLAATADGDVVVGFAAGGEGLAPLRRSDAVQIGFELEEFVAEGLEPKDTTGLVIFRLRP